MAASFLAPSMRANHAQRRASALETLGTKRKRIAAFLEAARQANEPPAVLAAYENELASVDETIAKHVRSADGLEDAPAPPEAPTFQAEPLVEDGKVVDAREAFDVANRMYREAEDRWTANQTADELWRETKKARDARDRAEALLRRAESDAKHAHERVEREQRAELRARLDAALERASDRAMLAAGFDAAVELVRADAIMRRAKAKLDRAVADANAASREAARLGAQLGGSISVPPDRGDFSLHVETAARAAMFEQRRADGIEPSTAQEPLFWARGLEASRIRSSHVFGEFIDRVIAEASKL